MINKQIVKIASDYLSRAEILSFDDQTNGTVILIMNRVIGILR